MITQYHVIDKQNRKRYVFSLQSNEQWEIEIFKSNLNLKFEIPFKQKSKFEFYFLFFEKLKK